MGRPGKSLRLQRIAVVAGTVIFGGMLTAGATAMVSGSLPAVSAATADTASPCPSPNPTASPGDLGPGPSPSPGDLSAGSGTSLSPGSSPAPSSSPTSSPSAGPSPTSFVGIAATPSTQLANGQYIKVTLCNLQPGEAMFFRQCIANFNPANLNTTDCVPLNTQVFGRANATGGGSVYFPVFANGDDMLKNAAGSFKIPCDSQDDCAIVAVTNLRHTYLARLRFAPNPAACPPETANAVQGSGSAAASRAMYLWSGATCLPPQSISTSYISHNEEDAYADFFRGPLISTDFGITGLGASPPASATTPSYKLAPLTTSAVVLAYRAFDNRGTQITTLTLTPDILAGLYMGQISNFSATQAITALNPGINFPSRVQIGARADHNSETYIFTQWLAAAAPSIWKPPRTDSPDIFPSIPALDLKAGERNTALEVINPTAGISTDVIYIAVMDSTTAAFFGLPTANIKLPDGSVVSANPDSIAKAINQAQVKPDGTLVPTSLIPSDLHPVEPPGGNSLNPTSGGYPMPMLTYMITPTDTIDPVKGDTLAKFLRYAVQDGQTLLTPVDGYGHLPANLVKASLAIADQIPSTTQPLPNPSPSPCASPSPSANPSPSPTANPSPSPSSSPSASPSPSPSASPSPSPSASPSPSPSASPSPSPTASPSPSSSPNPCTSPSPTSTPSATPTPEASPLPLPSESPLPLESIPPFGGTTPASGSRTGSSAASNSRFASLSYSQGLGLGTLAHDELGLAVKYVLLSLVALTVLVIGGGLGLQLWARRSIARTPAPEAT